MKIRDKLPKESWPLYDWLEDNMYKQQTPLPIKQKSTGRVIVPVKTIIRKYMLKDIVENRKDIFIQDSPISKKFYQIEKEL